MVHFHKNNLVIYYLIGEQIDYDILEICKWNVQKYLDIKSF